MTLFFLALTLPFVGWALSILLPARLKTSLVALFTIAGCALLLVVSLQVLTGKSLAEFISPSFHPFGILTVTIDPLAAIFLLLISLVTPGAMLYAIGFFSPKNGNHDEESLPSRLTSHLFFLVLLFVSMALLTVIRHALLFLVVWELMSLSSFFLVMYDARKKDVFAAGMQYLVMMHISFAFILSGFLYLYIKTGSYDFWYYAAHLQQVPSDATPFFVLMLIGFGFKAGLVPLHSWLPQAHPAAPAHVSGIMSGIMIKLGLFGLLRTILLMGRVTFAEAYAILGIGLLTALLGIINALVQNDMKKLLAYSSIENMGLVFTGAGLSLLGIASNEIGVACYGLVGTFIFMLNHGLSKSAVFFSAGSVYHATDTKDLNELGGLGRKMPMTAASTLPHVASLSALPPFGGFVGEFILIIGFFNLLSRQNTMASLTGICSVSILGMTGTLAILAYVKKYGIGFLGTPRSEKATMASEKGIIPIIPLVFAAALSLFIGLFPQLLVPMISSVVDLFVPEIDATFSLIKLTEVLTSLSTALLLLAGICVTLLAIRFLLTAGRKKGKGLTWGCGYQSPSSRMQYTGTSFVAPFSSIFKPLTGLHSHQTDHTGNMFPKKGTYMQHMSDIIDRSVIKPAMNLLERFFTRFAFIQSGKTQQYILYGILFLIAIIIYTILGEKP